MSRVLLAGAFGQRNPGDDALLAAFAAALPEHELVVPATDPDLVGLGGSAGLYVTPIDRSPVRLAAALLSCDAVVVGGGTLFKLLKPSTGRRPRSLLAQSTKLINAARALGKPVALVGVGADDLPDRHSRTLARRIATGADMLVVRDERSADLLAAMGVPIPIRVGADAAWTLLSDVHPREFGPAAEAGAGHVVVTPSRHAKGAGRYAMLAASLTSLLEERPALAGVRIEPWQVGGRSADDLMLARDLEAALAVAGCREVEVVAPPASVRTAAESYRHAALLVGQRFHSVLAAAAAGCRFIADTSEPKLVAMAESFGQVCLPEDASVSTVRAALAAALDGPAPDRGVVARHVASAEAMLGLTRTLLEGGRSGTPAELHALTLRPEALVR